MIRYSLVCERKHEFEIWFKNSADYDKQAKRGLVTCPSCGSAKVEKALMAPSLGRGTKKGSSEMIAVPPAPVETSSAEAPSQNLTSQVAMVPPQVMSPQEKELRAKLKELREKLDKTMTDEQKKARQEVLKEAREKGKEGKKGKELHQAINDAMKLTEEQQKKYDETDKQIVALRQEILEKVKPILTDEQKEKLPKRPERNPARNKKAA
mgnify:CR=1 FL=1